MTEKEILIKYVEYTAIDQMSEEDKELAVKAIEASKNAYAPYSGFNVGAALRLEDGSITTGANQENIAYPSGLCAERTAMFHAAAQHPDLAMLSIAVAATLKGELCASPATPCGACRQVMAEYQTKSDKPMSIILVGAEKIWKFSKVDDILPLIFDSLKK